MSDQRTDEFGNVRSMHLKAKTFLSIASILSIFVLYLSSQFYQTGWMELPAWHLYCCSISVLYFDSDSNGATVRVLVGKLCDTGDE